MKKEGMKLFVLGALLLGAFVIWTLLIQKVDVQPIGVNGTNIGFAGINSWFHKLTGVHMTLYTITDWLGLVPLVLILAMSREAYAIMVVFLLLVIKAIVLLRQKM